MKSRDSREWVSLEERSLELFNDEKFLKNRKDKANGKFGILSRLGISHEDLKIKNMEKCSYTGTEVQVISEME